MEQNTKELALVKMLDELKEDHNSTIDFIHNLICDNLDDELSVLVITEGKSIRSALNYALDILSKRVERNGSVGFVGGDNPELLELIKQYYNSDKTTFETSTSYKAAVSKTSNAKEDVEVENKTTRPNKPAKPKHDGQSQLLSIYDFMDKPIVELQAEDESDEDDKETDD